MRLVRDEQTITFKVLDGDKAEILWTGGGIIKSAFIKVLEELDGLVQMMRGANYSLNFLGI
jgi:hypothetical protein